MHPPSAVAPPPAAQAKALSRFFLAVAVLTVAGFAGYYFGFLRFIYQVMMPEAFSQFALVPLAVLFGTAAFFSPCAFTVLPAYVAHALAGEAAGAVPASEVSRSRLVGRGVTLGLSAAAGVVTVTLLVGLVIAVLGSAAPFAKDPRQDSAVILGIRVATGLLIALLGVLTVAGKPLPLGQLQRLLPRLSFRRSMFVYGLLYNGAAIGCTGPILLGLILYALSTGSLANALTVFTVFSLTMGVLMVALTTLTVVLQRGVVRRLAPFAPIIQRGAGWVMVVVGLMVAVLTLEGNRIFVQLFFPFLPFLE